MPDPTSAARSFCCRNTSREPGNKRSAIRPPHSLEWLSGLPGREPALERRIVHTALSAKLKSPPASLAVYYTTRADRKISPAYRICEVYRFAG